MTAAPTTSPADDTVEFLVPGLPYSAPELRGMEIAGLVDHVIGDLYLPADHGTDPARLRAAAVHRLAAPVLTGRWTIMGLTAAWILAGGPAPPVLEAAVDRYHRMPLRPLSVRLSLEQTDVVDVPDDVIRLGGLPCTGPARTVEDLLRRAEDPARAAPALAAAARLLPLTPAAHLRDRFERNRRRPGMAGARRALERLLTG
ncbi:hypothetical protein [Microbacterium sp. A93]|uniref:hypothetical protein n=1 Tax=Microbacterium sp. A93 TaxID=3450716 RepID=UPI003F43630C